MLLLLIDVVESSFFPEKKKIKKDIMTCLKLLEQQHLWFQPASFKIKKRFSSESQSKARYIKYRKIFASLTLRSFAS